MFNNPVTHLNCEKCAVGNFGNCISNKCIHGSLAKSVVEAAEAFFWNAKGTYKYIDKIICCSEFMKRKMDMNPLFAGKTVAQHNFIELAGKYDESEVDPSMELPKEYVLYFGRFS